MEIKINKVHGWSEQFFQEFLAIKIDFEKNYVDKYLKPTLMDFKKEFLSPYFIQNKVRFCGIILRDSQNKPLAQVVLYYKNHLPEEVLFGHFNLIDSKEVADVLFSQMDLFASEVSAKQIKGPMQGHFFFSYRLKIWGETPFFGEPVHPKFYHERFNFQTGRISGEVCDWICCSRSR